MCEGKVNWHYTCRVCGEIVQYGFAAGPAVNTCPKCKIHISKLKTRASKIFTNNLDAQKAFKEYCEIMEKEKGGVK